MKQHPCQETYSANLEEQQAPTQPIDEVEKAAEVFCNLLPLFQTIAMSDEFVAYKDVGLGVLSMQ
jgi:hypothetical protein